MKKRETKGADARLGIEFFRGKYTLELAPALIGTTLVHRSPQGILSGTIIETEAYTYWDASSHAFNNKRTARNSSMFLAAGHLYVYFVYGMHWCLNIVAEEEGKGCAVLIRALAPIQGVEIMQHNRGRTHNLTTGPANLCVALGIEGSFDGLNLVDPSSPCYLVAGSPIAIKRTTRIGIRREIHRKWRFVAHPSSQLSSV